jgi:hypothetical protein
MISIAWDSQNEEENEIPSSQQEDEKLNKEQVEKAKGKILKGYIPQIPDKLTSSDTSDTLVDLENIKNIHNLDEVSLIILFLIIFRHKTRNCYRCKSTSLKRLS